MEALWLVIYLLFSSYSLVHLQWPIGKHQIMNQNMYTDVYIWTNLSQDSYAKHEKIQKHYFDSR